MFTILKHGTPSCSNFRIFDCCMCGCQFSSNEFVFSKDGELVIVTCPNCDAQLEQKFDTDETSADFQYRQDVGTQEDLSKEITNGDWIRSLSNEEIAKLINSNNICEFCAKHLDVTFPTCDDGIDCELFILSWLDRKRNS